MIVMATSTPEDTDALRALRQLVAALGFAHVLYLLAEVADEQREAAADADDTERAKRARHDARILGEAAKQVLS